MHQDLHPHGGRGGSTSTSPSYAADQIHRILCRGGWTSSSAEAPGSKSSPTCAVCCGCREHSQRVQLSSRQRTTSATFRSEHKLERKRPSRFQQKKESGPRSNHVKASSNYGIVLYAVQESRIKKERRKYRPGVSRTRMNQSLRSDISKEQLVRGGHVRGANWRVGNRIKGLRRPHLRRASLDGSRTDFKQLSHLYI